VTNGESSVEGTEWYFDRKASIKEFIDIGYVRQRESIAAMKILGLDREDVIFLGYPDGALTEIIYSDEYTREVPFKSRFTDFSTVTHDNSRSMGAPFCRESISKDIEDLLTKFNPHRIYITHPQDSHPDHKACGILISGMADKVLESGTVLAYMIARTGVPGPKRRIVYKSTGQLTEKVLDSKTREIKKRCIEQYRSQGFLFDELAFHYEAERFWKLDRGMRAAIANRLIPDLKY
jgi:LmbE family N-acetylglucosaminyl deacetylase